jgi:DNA modification methylase
MNNEGIQGVFPTMADSLAVNPMHQNPNSVSSINPGPPLTRAAATEQRPMRFDFGNRLSIPIVTAPYHQPFINYTRENSLSPLFFEGDALTVLRDIPAESVHCVMTSPPYWGKREYESGGIGLERDYRDFVKHFAAISFEVKRVLRPEGSFWLNIGDSYENKGLVGVPWRVAFELTDRQGWLLRNSVVWNKVKSGMDNTKDRLGNVHENIFHFVKQAKGYYYNADAIRSKPRRAKVVKGAVISATGVSGVRYRRQIELSTDLTPQQKAAALKELENMLADISIGKVSDFRMIIRAQQRATHSDNEKLSGRAKELREKGFYFLRYHPNGSKPTDVWDIIPEDTQKRESHFAPYPVDLCRIPILATCPEGGLVLDPFCGTGTTLLAALSLGRKSVGIDISRHYLKLAEERCAGLL